MITKIQPDALKAKSLKNAADATLERLRTTDQEKYPTNTLNDYYDIIHKRMEAITLAEGIKFRGDGAHQELIDHVAKKLKLDENTRQFLQQMRDYRNRISYEGFTVNAEYIRQNKTRILKIISGLR